MHLSRFRVAGPLGVPVGIRARVTGVIFDWDGVLLDSLGASFNVYNKIFEKIDVRRLTRDEFLRLQSPNWYEFYSRVGLPTSLWKKVDEEWLRLYEQEDPRLYPDARKCVSDLKAAGFRLALVSNGSEARVERELKGFGLAPYFESVLYGRRIEELKPSPVMLEKTLATLGLEPSDAVYVGDAPVDIQASRNAKIPSVAIARGPILAERLRNEGPDHVFGRLGDLTEFLLGRS
jgi:AHBA synthesis associated protein